MTAPSSHGAPARHVPEKPAGAVASSTPVPELLQPWLEPFMRDEPAPLGSNNWVVSGAHTTTGKPLLSNDMHLGHQIANLWYEAHLHAGDFDVAGVTLPGSPYVLVGHNRRIAWGFTNVGPTVEDLYVETFNEQGQYLTPAGWKSPEVRREVIHVKHKPDVILDVQLTRHGPIVSDLVSWRNPEDSLAVDALRRHWQSVFSRGFSAGLAAVS